MFEIEKDKIVTAEDARHNVEIADELVRQKADAAAKEFIEEVFLKIDSASLNGSFKIKPMLPAPFQCTDDLAKEYRDKIVDTFRVYGYKAAIQNVSDRDGTNEHPCYIEISW